MIYVQDHFYFNRFDFWSWIGQNSNYCSLIGCKEYACIRLLNEVESFSIWNNIEMFCMFWTALKLVVIYTMVEEYLGFYKHDRINL